MAPGKSPAFQFYAKDFLTGTATMSLQEVGAYVRLLAYEWDSGVVPKSSAERARILSCSTAQEKAIWHTLVMKFVPVELGYVNSRLEEEREKQAEYRRRQSDRGKASANRRSNAGSTPVATQVTTPVEPAHQPDGQPEVNSSSSSSSSSSVPNSSKNDELGVTRPPTLIARGEGVKWFQRHGHHLDGFCDWVCFDMGQVDEFAGKIPGSDLGLKRQQIKEWALAIRDTWGDRIVPDGSNFDFWRNRWTETHGGSRPANATLKAAKAAHDLDEAFR